MLNQDSVLISNNRNIDSELENAYPPIQLLARHVDDRYKNCGYNQSHFPDIAAQALANFKNYHDIDPTKISNWIAKSRNLPIQLQSNPELNLFGEPAVTLFSSHEFVIDAYLWRSTDTVIHDHGFNGAFTVVRGKTLHVTYHFAESYLDNNEGVAIGSLVRDKVELLDNLSQITKIHSGKKLIHSTAHLILPTITLCIRTIRDQGAIQYNYYPPSIAISDLQKFNNSLILALIPYHYACSRNDLIKYVENVVSRRHVTAAINVIHYFLAYTGDKNTTKKLLKLFHTRFPKLALALIETVNYIIVNNPICHEKAMSEEAKIICQLLKNSKCEKDLLSLITKLFPTENPESAKNRLVQAAISENIIPKSFKETKYYYMQNEIG